VNRNAIDRIFVRLMLRSLGQISYRLAISGRAVTVTISPHFKVSGSLLLDTGW
jgi:hypothetical protein